MICNSDMLFNEWYCPLISRSISLTAPCGPVAIPAHQNKQNSMEKLDSKCLFCCKMFIEVPIWFYVHLLYIHAYVLYANMTRQKYNFGELFFFDSRTQPIRANKQNFNFSRIDFFPHRQPKKADSGL